MENFNDENDFKLEEDEDEIAGEQVQEDTIQKQNDHSINWLIPEVSKKEEGEQLSASMVPMELDNQKSKPISDSHPESKNIPDVKTSAVTGVGLQELLQLIDEKLMQNDKVQQSQRVMERSEFDRKWRPTSPEKMGIAME